VRKHVIQCRRIVVISLSRNGRGYPQRSLAGSLSSEDINRIINQRNNDLLSNVAILFGARKEIAAQRTFCIQIRLETALGNGAINARRSASVRETSSLCYRNKELMESILSQFTILILAVNIAITNLLSSNLPCGGPPRPGDYRVNGK